MKVFISWSGETSLELATAMQDWLPKVIQSLSPYMSAEDTDKGARWANDIANELEKSSFGVLCVTKDNLDSPWLNFEAGALGKSVDKGRVSPVLFGVKPSDLPGPLKQFQAASSSKTDILKLVQSLNGALGEEDQIDSSKLHETFEVWWPKLDEKIKAIKPSSEKKAKSPSSDSASEQIQSAIEEILEISRRNHVMLQDQKEGKLPSAHNFRSTSRGHPVYRDLARKYAELYDCAQKLTEFDSDRDLQLIHRVYQIIERLYEPINYIDRRFGSGDLKDMIQRDLEP